MDALVLLQHPKELQNPAARQGFAPGDAQLCDTQRSPHAHDAGQFLVSQDLGTRQPFLQLLRHTIQAALVAAVSDGHPQITDEVTV